jgi:hypothetical protein
MIDCIQKYRVTLTMFLFLVWNAYLPVIFAQTSSPCLSTDQFTDQALTRSSDLLDYLIAQPKRDSVRIDSLVSLTRRAHDSSLSCGRHLSAMMLLATSEAAKKLPLAENIIIFRLRVRDTRLFLAEARKYWNEGR